MASTVIYRDSVSTGHNKFTFSAWVKRNKLSSPQSILGMYDNNDLRGKIRFDHNNGDDLLYVWIKNAVGTEFNWYSDAKFRDINAWYHIVVAIDTTQSTASNRYKIYVNGEEASGTSSGQDIVHNSTTHIFGHSKHSIGNSYYNGSWEAQYFDGLMSHVHCCYGYAYQASDFGETDSTTGEWKIKTSPSVSYGTNGHFILKDGNSTTDQSGNNISLTTNGTLTKTEDSPSNIFCTGNPLARYSGNLNFTHGNNYITSPSNNWTMGSCNLGAATGKWYWEMKILVNGTGNGYFKMGFISDQAHATNTGHIAESALDGGYAFYCQNGNLEVRNDDAVISGYAVSDLNISFTTGDIMCLAVDMDNKRAYFRKNDGSWIKSANPVSGTNGLDISGDYTAGKAMIPAFAIYYPGQAAANFGNGYFGTSQVSSAGTNASGNGIFEYDVPTGYTALSTKGLNL
tara:strand:- start:1067 stop:2434 length:1368 start_codon:yes stop_codon:yes gene_type:complete